MRNKVKKGISELSPLLMDPKDKPPRPQLKKHNKSGSPVETLRDKCNDLIQKLSRGASEQESDATSITDKFRAFLSNEKTRVHLR